MNNKNKMENTIKHIIQPIEEISFPLFIKAISGCEVIPLNIKNEDDRNLLKDLINVCKAVVKKTKEKGIKNKNGESPKRPNEAGNYIEPYVRKELSKYGYAITPKTKENKQKSQGYPDIEFWYGGEKEEEGRVIYIEIKTFSRKTINSTQRTFYASPPKEEKGVKIRYNAPHICLSFEIEEKNNNYYAKAFKITDLSRLKGRIKVEFNASNKELYAEDLILYEES